MRKILFLCFLLSFSFTAHAQNKTQDKEGIVPEIATGVNSKKAVQGKDFMVVTANPYASKAAYIMLKNGGSAVDAAIAAQLVLNLVEPQSSGIGGGAFALYWDQKNKELKAYDGRETAPMKATETLFQDAESNSLPFWDAVVGGRSVGTPGTIKLLEHLHQKHGLLSWESLFYPAIYLAKNGFRVTPRLAKSIKNDKFLKNSNTANSYFFCQMALPFLLGMA